MAFMSDHDTLRDRIRRDVRRPDGGPRRAAGSPAVVGQLATGSTAVVGQFADVVFQTVTGAETLGLPGTFTADSVSTPVLMLGPGAPSSGEMFVCRHVGYRWVSQFHHASAGCTLCLTAVDTSGNPEVGATVTVKDDSGATVATGTTDSSGKFCAPVPGAGHYTATITKAGYTTITQDVYPCESCACRVPRVLTLTQQMKQICDWFDVISDAPWTLTYGARPAGLPATGTTCSYGYPYSLPAASWWGGPFPMAATAGSPQSYYQAYIRAYVHACTISIEYYVYSGGSGYYPKWYRDDWGTITIGLNGAVTYPNSTTVRYRNTCSPFVMQYASVISGGLGTTPSVVGSTSGILTGTHGSDDIPLVSNSAGN